MFFGRKKKEEEAKKKSTLEKVIMGAIIGTAIGSVIGLTVAPKKGSETRQIFKKKIDDRENYKEDLEEIGKLTKETVVGLGTLVKNFVFGRKSKSKTPRDSGAPPDNRAHNGFKKIPHETLETTPKEPLK